MEIKMDGVLTSPQSQALQAAVNRIIPADDYPCGWDAGVSDFFTLLFAREPGFVPVYRSGLDALNEEARRAAGSAFADLDAARQDALLTQIEAGGEQAAFFHLLVEQTMEGFYADPGNGGNRDGIAWDMIGYRMTA